MRTPMPGRSGTARERSRRDDPGAVRLADVPLAGLHRQRLPVGRGAAAGSRDRPGQPRGARHLRHATHPIRRDRQYQNYAGGGYFFLDARDRIWSATKTSHLFVLQVPRRPQHHQGRRYDLTGVLEDDEPITSALPDSRAASGSSPRRTARSASSSGTRRIRVERLGEDIQNSFAVGKNGVYIVSSERMYRFTARKGRPRIVWAAGTATAASSSPARPTPARARPRPL